MMRKLPIIAALGLALLVSAGGDAAEPGSPPGDAGAMAKAPGVPDSGQPGPPTFVRPKGPPIALESGKGMLIRLSGPANTVFIANPEVADVTIKTPSLIYLIAKAPGETVLYAVDADDRVLMNAPVHVDHDLPRVRRSLSSIAPGENVAVSSVDNSLVLNGSVSSAGRAEKVRSLAASIASETKGSVVNRLGVTTPNQVSIRVKIAEVNRTVLKSLGVNWTNIGNQHIKFNTTNPTAAGATFPTSQLAVAFGGASWLTQATVDALAQEGLVSILAEPNLTATNGQPASFLAGGEFPVPVASTGTVAGAAPVITVEFKRFGVELNVVPTIIDPEHLNLKIRSEISALSAEGAVKTADITIPALTKRSAETTVELGSGESYALAGLLQNSDQQDISKVPLLGDIPVLGQLFRSQQFQRKETELVIIVTPYLVQPAPTVASLALPTDGLVVAHDAQQFYSGGAYRQTLPPPVKGPVGPGDHGLIGPVGFRLD
jgi:pilus assembly protein CpaC